MIDLDELRRLLAAATPRELCVDPDDDHTVIDHLGYPVVLCDGEIEPAELAALIAAAVTALPELLRLAERGQQVAGAEQRIERLRGGLQRVDFADDHHHARQIACETLQDDDSAEHCSRWRGKEGG